MGARCESTSLTPTAFAEPRGPICVSQGNVLVARIGRPHGLRGEVTVQVHTDAPEERLRVGARLDTQPSDAGPLVIDSVRVHQERYLIGFVGVLDRNGAEHLRNTKLYIGGHDEPATVRGPVDADRDGLHTDSAADAADGSPEAGFYEDDLIGMQVVASSGDLVGTVSGLHTRPAQDLLEISRPGGPPVLVPFVAALVPEVDTARRRIVIDPPAGLLDLGR